MSNNDYISFPVMIDSSVANGIITLNDDLINLKERHTQIEIILMNENNKKDKLDMLCDYNSLVNINYKMKSACNQIEEYIKHMAK